VLQFGFGQLETGRRKGGPDRISAGTRRECETSDATWSGWVQERGLYFLADRDRAYADLVELSEPSRSTPAQARGPRRGPLRRGALALRRPRPLAPAPRRHPGGLPAAGEPAEPGRRL